MWSGADALERGLVDALGGLDAAVEQVRERLAGKMSDRARDKLRPKVIRVRRLELPPPEPRKVGEQAVAALLNEVEPRAAALFRLTRGGERVLCYALDLPTIE